MMSDSSHKEQKKPKPVSPGVPAVDSASKVKLLEEQVKKLTDIAGRAQADLQNAKARMEKDGDELRKFASEHVLRTLLPVIDNFQRAFQHLPSDLASHEWVKGVSAVEQSLLKQVSDLGLRKIDALGKTADPSKHDVLMQGPGEAGKVVEVFEEGYELHGRVLRPAKVRVGDGSSVAASA